MKWNEFLNEWNISFILKLFIIILLFFLLYIIFLVKDVIVIVSFSFIIAIIFSPILAKLKKFRIWDVVWTIFLYFIVLILFTIALFAIIPIFVEQTQSLVEITKESITKYQTAYEQSGVDWLPIPNFMKSYLEWVLVNIHINEIFESIKNNFSSISSVLWKYIKSIGSWWFSIISNVTSSVFTFIITIIFSFFVILERKSIVKFIYDIAPRKLSIYLKSKEWKISDIIYNWLIWQCILAVSMFIMTLIWLYILSFIWINLENKIWLALIVWLMEFIPVIWPLIALLPALAISINLWIWAMIWVTILYIIIQQIEWNFLVPYVMWSKLNLSAFYVFLMMSLWASIYWVIWIILSIPFAAIIKLFVDDFIFYKKSLENK